MEKEEIGGGWCQDGVEFKNEVDKYSLDDRETFFDDSFDLLNQWKLNGRKYKILFYVVKDILAVPISIVAYESALTAVGRIL